MTLKKKMALMLLLILFVSSLVYFAVFKLIVFKSFLDAEDGDAMEKMRHCISVLKLEEKHLDRLAHDWASWDSAYMFAEDRNQDFIAENLGATVYKDQNLNLIHFYNRDGRLVWGETYDLKTGKELPVYPAKELASSVFSRLMDQGKQGREAGGIIQTSIGPMLVAVRPILTSDNAGPSRGALIMGRMLTPDYIASLSELTGVNLNAWAVRHDKMPKDVRSNLSVLSRADSIRLVHASSEVLHAYTIIRDMENQPVMVLKASFPRLITQRGTRAYLVGLMFLLGAGLLIFISISGIFGVYVLNPIARMTENALAIGVSSRTLGNIDSVRNDEIGILSRELAAMLDRLSRSEERYSILAENARDVIWVSDFELGITYVSPSVLQLRGYTVDEALKQDLEQILTPESYRYAREIIETEISLEQSGQPHDPGWSRTLELQMSRKDGSTVWTEVVLSLIFDDIGMARGLMGITRDITERKRSEDDIRKSEERYRTIFETTATANIIIAEDTTILMANNNFASLSGYSKQDLEGKISWTIFIHEDDLERMKGYHKARRIDPGRAPSSYDFRFVSREGKIRDLIINVAVIPETKHSIASMIDITEWKLAEKEKVNSEARFQELAQLLPETVYETDENGVFTFVNQTGFEKFGYAKEDLGRGFTAFDMIAPADHSRMVATYKRLIRGETVGLGEYTARKRDGSTFPALVHATAIFRDGRPVGHRGFIIDISEKKFMENQLARAQKMEAIGTLAGGIAHDFNNLLMGILGNISLILLQVDHKNPIFERLKNIEGYVQRGSDLTKQLLGFARGGKYEVKPTDLGEFIRESSDLFGRTKKEIHIHHKTQDGLWTVEVDRGQMEQVLLNLYLNAWHAMPHGGDLYLSEENVELDSVAVSPYEIAPGRFVRITITDTGIGMDEATKARIFEPFFSTKERGRGTGLGLASAYGIIKNHGGFINVESRKDVGTTFTIYLPACDKDVDIHKFQEEELCRGKETVLLIDDEEMILDVSKKMLEQLGYKVIAASGGKMGVQVYEHDPGGIDLVILDMVMPDFGGRESFDALARINPDVKVLLSSGYSLDGQAKEIMQRGCRGFIQKPFTISDLSKKIRDILDKQSSR